MPPPARIFIGHDFVMDAALDAAAAELHRRGHTIIRGPAATPGVKQVFAPACRAGYFAATDVIVISTRCVVDEALLDGAPRLRGIVFPSIGTESVDLAQAGRRGLIVANGATPENFLSLAEATVMLMLNLKYDLRGSERLLRTNGPRPPVPTARMLLGSTIGLVGMGRIARGVVQRLEGWGVRILACDPALAPGQAPAGVALVTLDELLAASDIVSLHTTLTPESTGLIGAAELRKMKRGAYLVNTSRGLCADEAAVCEALADGTIAGAALDAFEVEPLPANSPLRELDNAILTPHMVGHTQELYASFAPACVANVEHILRGELPPYCCNPQAADPWRARVARLDGRPGATSTPPSAS